MGKINCCKDCPNRTPTCHSTCSDYIIEAAFNAVAREEHVKECDRKYELQKIKQQAIRKNLGMTNKDFQLNGHCQRNKRRWRG